MDPDIFISGTPLFDKSCQGSSSERHTYMCTTNYTRATGASISRRLRRRHCVQRCDALVGLGSLCCTRTRISIRNIYYGLKIILYCTLNTNFKIDLTWI